MLLVTCSLPRVAVGPNLGHRLLGEPHAARFDDASVSRFYTATYEAMPSRPSKL